MVAAVSRALRELSEPCLGWTREPRRQPKSLGARRQYSQATANNVLPVMTGSPAFLTRPPPANIKSFSVPGGRFKNAYELLNLRALKISMLYESHIFQCMGKIFCVEFQRVPLKFHTKYLAHTLIDKSFMKH